MNQRFTGVATKQAFWNVHPARIIHPRHAGWGLALLVAGWFIFGAGQPPAVQASSFIVTSQADTGGSVCAAGCTLRQAITAANAAGSGPHTITFQLGSSSIYTITLTGALPAISTTLTIQGPNSNGGQIVIDGNNQFRPFVVNSGQTLTLQNLTVSRGHVQGAGGTGNYGGAIFNNGGTVNLNGVTLNNNSALGESGSFTNSSGVGGAIYNTNGAQLNITGSTFSGNVATGMVGGGGYGGAIYNDNHSRFTISGSIFNGNQAQGNSDLIFAGQAWGGAITSISPSTMSIITNSTFSANSATGGSAGSNGGSAWGGALYIDGGQTTFLNVTITGNTLTAGTGPNARTYGAGIYSNLSVQLANSLVAGNTSPTFGPDLWGQFVSQGYNLVGKGDHSSGLVNGVNGDQVGTIAAPIAPGLGPLQNNGGPTLTHNLLPGSPAINAANPDNTLALPTDQRGFVRIIKGRQDIGAVESGQIAVNDSGDIARSTDGKCTLREAINAALNDTPSGPPQGECVAGNGADTVTFLFSVPTTITLGSPLPNLDGPISIVGPPDAPLTISGNTTTQIMRVNTGGVIDISNLTLANGQAPDGGAISYNGKLTLDSLTFRNNQATSGGALIALNNSAQLTITNSTFYQNSALQEGGAINNLFGTAVINNSTFTANSANNGGAINNSATLSLLNSTVVSNTATSGGGGIYRQAGNITARNSLFYGNTAPAGPDMLGNLTSQGYNLVGNTAGMSGLAVTDLTGVNPNLGPLQNNGGPTLTLLPHSGSPAIDAGDPSPAGLLATDQRGAARVADGANTGTARVDIGAVELAPPNLSLNPGAVTYTENAPPLLLNSRAKVTFYDGTTWDGGNLTLAFSANGTVDDRLAVRDQGNGPGQIGVSGNTISYEGAAIGTLSGGTGTTPLVITFSGPAATTPAVEALLLNLTFANVSNTPSLLSRTVSITARGGQLGDGPAATRTVIVKAVNDPPFFTATISDQTMSANSTLGPLSFAVSDLENPEPSAGLNVTAASHNLTLLANSGISVTNTPGNRSVTIQPNLGQSGTVSVTLTVSDGAASSQTGFLVTVQPLATSTGLASDPNPSVYGQSVSLTASVSISQATGTVVFTNTTTGQSLGSSPLQGGVATLSVASLPTGDNQIEAIYQGQNAYLGSQSPPITQTVMRGASTLSLGSAPNPSQLGQSVVFSATVGQPGASGVVTFTRASDNKPLGVGTLNASGVATYSIATLPAGNTVIQATYGGDSNYLGSTSNTATQQVLAVGCDRLLVIIPTDNGVGDTCGTLSFALRQDVPLAGQTIRLALVGSDTNTITFSGPLLWPLKAGVTLAGGPDCNPATPQVIIDAGGLSNKVWQLPGSNTLRKVWLKGFKLVAGPGGANFLECSRISN